MNKQKKQKKQIKNIKGIVKSKDSSFSNENKENNVIEDKSPTNSIKSEVINKKENKQEKKNPIKNKDKENEEVNLVDSSEDYLASKIKVTTKHDKPSKRHIPVYNRTQFLKSPILFKNIKNQLNAITKSNGVVNIMFDSLDEKANDIKKNIYKKNSYLSSDQTELTRNDIESTKKLIMNYFSEDTSDENEYDFVYSIIRDILMELRSNTSDTFSIKDERKIINQYEAKNNVIEDILDQKQKRLHQLVSSYNKTDNDLSRAVEEEVKNFCKKRGIIYENNEVKYNDENNNNKNSVNNELLVEVKNNDNANNKSKSQYYKSSDLINMYVNQEIKDIEDKLKESERDDVLYKTKTENADLEYNEINKLMESLEFNSEIVNNFIENNKDCDLVDLHFKFKSQ